MLIKKPADIKSAEITPKDIVSQPPSIYDVGLGDRAFRWGGATGLDWFQLPSDARPRKNWRT